MHIFGLGDAHGALEPRQLHAFDLHKSSRHDAEQASTGATRSLDDKDFNAVSIVGSSDKNTPKIFEVKFKNDAPIL